MLFVGCLLRKCFFAVFGLTLGVFSLLFLVIFRISAAGGFAGVVVVAQAAVCSRVCV